jgi:hypothetical protein
VNARSAKTTELVVESARTVKLYVAAAVGVPDSTPAVDNATPGGKEPVVTEKPVALAFDATRVNEYATD